MIHDALQIARGALAAVLILILLVFVIATILALVK